jgi:hypothetical protein
MKQAYRVLAFLVAAGVMLQAASVAYGMFDCSSGSTKAEPLISPPT